MCYGAKTMEFMFEIQKLAEHHMEPLVVILDQLYRNVSPNIVLISVWLWLFIMSILVIFCLRPFKKAKKLAARAANERNGTAGNNSHGTENRRHVMVDNNGDEMEVEQEGELEEADNAERGNQAGRESDQAVSLLSLFEDFRNKALERQRKTDEQIRGLFELMVSQNNRLDEIAELKKTNNEVQDDLEGRFKEVVKQNKTFECLQRRLERLEASVNSNHSQQLTAVDGIHRERLNPSFTSLVEGDHAAKYAEANATSQQLNQPMKGQANETHSRATEASLPAQRFDDGTNEDVSGTGASSQSPTVNTMENSQTEKVPRSGQLVRSAPSSFENLADTKGPGARASPQSPTNIMIESSQSEENPQAGQQIWSAQGFSEELPDTKELETGSETKQTEETSHNCLDGNQQNKKKDQEQSQSVREESEPCNTDKEYLFNMIKELTRDLAKERVEKDRLEVELSLEKLRNESQEAKIGELKRELEEESDRAVRTERRATRECRELDRWGRNGWHKFHSAAAHAEMLSQRMAQCENELRHLRIQSPAKTECDKESVTRQTPQTRRDKDEPQLLVWDSVCNRQQKIKENC